MLPILELLAIAGVSGLAFVGIQIVRDGRRSAIVISVLVSIALLILNAKLEDETGKGIVGNIYCSMVRCRADISPLQPDNDEAVGRAQAKAAADAQAEAARLADEERQRQLAAARSCIRNSFLLPNATRTPQETARLVRQTNTSGCPSEYRATYDSHMYAWSDYAEIKTAQRQLEDQAPIALIAEVAARLAGADESPAQNYSDVAERLRALAEDRNDRINSTYRELRSIALLYDVTPP